MIDIYYWVQDNMRDIIQIITGIITIASIIVKFTPTLKDDEGLLKVIKFLSKYIALNRTVDDDKIRKENGGE